MGKPAAVTHAHIRLVCGDKEMDLLRQHARAHEGCEDFSHLAQAIADFLFRLEADALFRCGVIEQAGRRLDHEIVVARGVSGIAKLAHQHDRAPSEVVRQDGCGAAAVIGLAMLRLPFAVAPAPFQRRVVQFAIGVRQDADILDADAVGNAHGSPNMLITVSARGRRAIWRRSCAAGRNSRWIHRRHGPWRCRRAPSVAASGCPAPAASLRRLS